MGMLAFVIAARPYRESSLLLELFTREEGRSPMLARGVRSARVAGRRAVLEPFRLLAVDCRGRGELRTLARAEILAEPRALAGGRLFAGLYLNELLYRLLPRRDPHPRLFERYAGSLAELAETPRPGWTLLRFERDLLAELGYGLELERDARGRPIEADRRYRLDPEGAPQPSTEASAFSGAAFLALADDLLPPPAVERECRALLAAARAAHFPARRRRPAWFAALAAARRSGPGEAAVDDGGGAPADPHPVLLDQQLDEGVVADLPPLADP
jgi:DNA repair protein RecO (recombination protein O)